MRWPVTLPVLAMCLATVVCSALLDLALRHFPTLDPASQLTEHELVPASHRKEQLMLMQPAAAATHNTTAPQAHGNSTILQGGAIVMHVAAPGDEPRPKIQSRAVSASIRQALTPAFLAVAGLGALIVVFA